jgi:predicted AlkP superfamily phosphohydrolase/phosphomutase
MNRIHPLLFLMILASGLSGCGEDAVPTVSQRTVVLGFDGMDPVLVQGWMDEGKLPNFSRLREQGHFAPLGTSNPPQSPVAWSSFATGLNPGSHGIYDFLRRDAESYAPDFSISRVVAPDSVALFGYDLPVSDGQILNRRVGEPFWTTLEAEGGRATVLRVPVTFPPDNIHRMLSGMGVPDLLGTQGTYTVYSTRPATAASSSSTRSVRMRPTRNGSIETSIEGPLHPLDPKSGPLTVALHLEPMSPGVRAVIQDQSVELTEGEWSDWVTLEFEFLGLLSVTGNVRLHLVQDYPHIQLYVSPIHIDPRNPVVPLSSPPDYAAKLADRIGTYHTIGMPEETWSLNEGHLSDQAFLDMERTILAEREAMFFDALDQKDSDLVVGVFVQTDRISHMFYRGIDPQHPLFAATDETARGAIEWIYGEADRILGETLSTLGPDDRLIVVSDHGFAPFRHAVHLNRWLLDNGYLSLNEGATESGIGFAAVDWSRTRAYAGGLNGIFLNVAGRESQGIVAPSEAAALSSEISAALTGALDPRDQQLMVREVFLGEAIYDGNANQDRPDLVIGYEPGYRASWQTTLGAVPGEIVGPNDRKWSGDHCITPEAVPGVLFTNFALQQPINAIDDIAEEVLRHWRQHAAHGQ